ncbi:hypothetical protein GCM10007937_08780 [Mesorhizobium albiziae]|nr:hypothetical protein GCM10007937_08780 [Mesorhizobium albiziae]
MATDSSSSFGSGPLPGFPFRHVNHAEEVARQYVRLLADQAFELRANLRSNRCEIDWCAKQARQVSVDDAEIVLRNPGTVEGRVMENANDTIWPDSNRSIRHSFKYLGVVGEKDVACRDIIARQPNHA